jgi:hypothetical protein
MAQDAYQFDAEGFDPSDLYSIVKKLKAAPKGKDSLIKLLKVGSTLFIITDLDHAGAPLT